jgi:acetyl esterase
VRWVGAASLAAVLALAGCGAVGAHEVAPTSSLSSSPPSGMTQGDIVYRTVDGRALALDAYLPAHPIAKPVPAIVVVHGGSFSGGNRRGVDAAPFAAVLAGAGYAAFTVDYRLLPDHPYPAALSDVQAAVSWLREPGNAARFGIDPSRIGALGGSAGAILVAEAGTAGTGPLDRGSRLRAVVAISGVMDFTDTGLTADLPASELKRGLAYVGCHDTVNCPAARDASALFAVDPSDPAFFLAHSIDEDLPEQSTVALAQALRRAGVPVQLELRPGSKHSLAMLDAAMRRRILDFYSKHL